MSRIITAVLGVALLATVALGDEAPISGTVKAVDASANTLAIESAAKGKTRDVAVYLRPDTKIVRFARAAEPGKTGFVEQPLALTDLKPGWVVSVTAKHEGGKEVAEAITVVMEGRR